MSISIKEIKALLDSTGMEYEYRGKENLAVEGFSVFSEPKPNTVVWIKNVDNLYSLGVENKSNLLIIADRSLTDCIVKNHSSILAEHSRSVFFEILNNFFPPQRQINSIVPTATVETKDVGQNVTIGHNCYICDGVSIGNNVVIKHNVVIECPTVIGNDCIIESGTVIGTAGYGYYELSDKRIRKVPDYGGVSIGNRVEIGSNVCIARGTLLDTIIDDDVKIDNFCHIAHNVHIGARSYVVAGTIVCGSCKICEDAYIAPGAVIMNQKTVGKNAFVGMGAVVTQDVVDNMVVTGYPARPIITRDKL